MTLPRAPGLPLHVRWEGAPPVPGDVLESAGVRVFYRIKTVVEIAPGALTLLVSRHASPQPGPGGVVHPWARTARSTNECQPL